MLGKGCCGGGGVGGKFRYCGGGGGRCWSPQAKLLCNYLQLISITPLYNAAIIDIFTKIVCVIILAVTILCCCCGGNLTANSPAVGGSMWLEFSCSSGVVEPTIPPPPPPSVLGSDKDERWRKRDCT
jgi:hypothetical protein